MGNAKVKASNIAWVYLAACLFFGLSVSAIAGTVSLPQTGQTICYDTGGVVTPCGGTGQDGDTRAGLPWPTPRFTNNGNGTITDNLTGLVWDQTASMTATSWQEALDAVKALNAAKYKGFSDWRLSNINELESLVMSDTQGQESYLWLRTQGFSGVTGAHYWTSTTSAYYWEDPGPLGLYTFALMVAPGYGTMHRTKAPGQSQPIWMVRGITRGPAQVRRTGVSICTDMDGAIISCTGTGQDGELQEGVASPADRFTIVYGDANGRCANQSSDCDDNPSTDVVLDTLTNRMWLRDTNLLDMMSWQGALTAVQTLNSGAGFCGYSDWRVPNEKESFSLFDYAQYMPAFSLSHPFVNVMIYNIYWTSTSMYGESGPDYALGTNISMGYKGGEYKSNQGYLWPVRTADAGPDLHALLSIPANPVKIGDPLTYDITVTNYGPGTAAGVALTDPLPAGVVYGSHTTSQGTCGYDSGVVSCNLGDIAQNGTVTVTLNTTAPGTPGQVVNSAVVTTSSADPNLTNNQTEVSVRVSNTLYTLTVLKDGTGDGTVSGGEVDCGPVCAPPVLEQTRITLAAAPDGQSAFYGWSGAGCSGKGSCEILMDGNKTVSAVFNRTIGSVMLPKTGVTISYAPGDDGALRRGVSWPNPRFTVIYGDAYAPCADQGADCDGENHNEVVTRTDVVLDNLTGLMWFRNGNFWDWDTSQTNLWGVFYGIDNFFNAPNSSYNPCGYHDWRLPNVNEMASLITLGQSPAWLNSQGFVDIQRNYWTSTTSLSSPSEAWYVDIAGYIGRIAKSNNFMAFFMLVRDTTTEPRAQVMRTGQTTCYDNYSGNGITCAGTGQDGELQKGVAPPSPRFANPDGSIPAVQNVVLDRLTHLMWTRDAYLPGVTKNWQGALDYVAGLNADSGYGGYTDWRLPNPFELRSLQVYSPVLSGTAFGPSLH